MKSTNSNRNFTRSTYGGRLDIGLQTRAQHSKPITSKGWARIPPFPFFSDVSNPVQINDEEFVICTPSNFVCRDYGIWAFNVINKQWSCKHQYWDDTVMPNRVHKPSITYDPDGEILYMYSFTPVGKNYGASMFVGFDMKNGYKVSVYDINSV